MMIDKETRERIIALVHKEVVPAIGCTEPMAVALCTARATEQLGCKPEKIEALLSANILKNAMGVGIPGTGMTGLPIAIALGALIGKSAYQLEVLRDLTPEALEAGKTVLLDRYVYSNIAYQCAKLPDAEERKRLRDWIFNTEYGDFGLPVPDLNLFLDVPIGFVEQSLRQQRSGQDRNYLHGAQDIHEASIAFQRTVRSIYLAETERDARFRRIDCADENGLMLPPEAIFERVRSTIDPYLP